MDPTINKAQAFKNKLRQLNGRKWQNLPGEHVDIFNIYIS